MDEEKIFDKRWQLASTEQRARFNNLLSSYPTIDWTFKEKKYLLWLSQLDIDTFETFEVITDLDFARNYLTADMPELTCTEVAK